MSTQSYYKDRLGFDPREALYESSGGSNGNQPTMIKTGSRTSRIVQHQQYGSSSSIQHSNGHGHDHHQGSPSKKSKHSSYSSTNAMHSASYVSSASPGGNISANIAAINSSSNDQTDGYEDALTQFKGTMSIWDYFVENWDVTGTINTNNLSFKCRICVALSFFFSPHSCDDRSENIDTHFSELWLEFF